MIKSRLYRMIFFSFKADGKKLDTKCWWWLSLNGKLKQSPKHQYGTEKRGWNKRMNVIKLTFGHYNGYLFYFESSPGTPQRSLPTISLRW